MVDVDRVFEYMSSTNVGESKDMSNIPADDDGEP